ncbi:MAG: DUF2973 domain-containing protein [Symploca sp. SIO2G7]|nr:DUF2973 domain-containing protein [Symploca sp. SIO2G7]
MLHLIYLIAFTAIAFLAIANLIRNLFTLSMESQRHYSKARKPAVRDSCSQSNSTLHPEMLDETGKPINEPLLVMRSLTVEDVRQQLDALYNSSPGNSNTGKQEEI